MSVTFYNRQSADILEFLPDPTFAIDRDGRVILWNGAIEKMTGVNKEDMIGRNGRECSVLFYGRKRPMLIDLLREPDQELESTYHRIERNDGTIIGEVLIDTPAQDRNRYLWGKASHLTDQDGNITGAIESIRDITAWKLLENEIAERRKAERELKKAQEMYRSIFEHAVEGIFQTTPDGRFIHVNPAMARILGYLSPQELIDSVNSIANQIYVDPESRDEFMKLQNDNNSTQLFTTQCHRKDGSVIWVSINSRAVTGENGKISYYEGFLQDITQIKRAEKALKESEERYRIAIENSNDGVAIIQYNTHVYVNQKFLEIFGYEDRNEIIGKPVLKTIHQDDLTMVYRYARMRFKGKEGPSRYEFRGVKKDGTFIFVEVSTAAVTYGPARAILCYLHDISERKRMQDELLTKKKLESIGILAGGIAHDFNNMLAAIIGSISLAKIYSQEDDRLLEFLQKAEKASMQASELTKRMITFSRGGAPMKTKVDICVLIRKAVEACLGGSTVQCVFSFDREPAVILLDEGQMRQVINNIILNSRESMLERGVIHISTENAVIDRGNSLSLSPGEYIRISIADRGIGIPGDNLARIFDPYFTTKDVGSARGMGLGLTVCYSIVKNHGGTIIVSSEVGQGTTMTLYVPGSENDP